MHHSARDCDHRARPALWKLEGPDGCQEADTGGPEGFRASTRHEGREAEEEDDAIGRGKVRHEEGK